METIFPARVLPLLLSDSDFVGGVSLVERLKVFVPRGIARRRGQGDALTWNGDVLTWNGDPLRWGGGDGALIPDDSIPFLAAFEDRQADVLVHAGIAYVVEESQSWPRYTRANCIKGNLICAGHGRNRSGANRAAISPMRLSGLIEAQAAGTAADAAGTAADASSTAAVEAGRRGVESRHVVRRGGRGSLGAGSSLSGGPGADGART